MQDNAVTEACRETTRALYAHRRRMDLHRARMRSVNMTATEEEIMAEAERGQVVCELYSGTDQPNPDGVAKDRLCNALADAGKLKLWEIKGSRWSPFGMVSRWIKA